MGGLCLVSDDGRETVLVAVFLVYGADAGLSFSYVTIQVAGGQFPAPDGTLLKPGVQEGIARPTHR